MQLRAETWVRVPRGDLFPFFADAANLQALTPPWLHFSILTPQPIAMHEGTRIAYRLRVHGIPIGWESAITSWNPPRLFVDEQRKGPYKRWVHTHRFVDEHGGTRVLDEVQFELFGGRLLAPIVARDLRQIFTYRHHELHRRFSAEGAPEPAIVIAHAGASRS
jgi:ligand-binding SRPBCC domain-containing protein